MSQDTPASIAKELVAAIDAFEIIDGDPPTISDFDRYYLLAAIREVDGPDVDAEARLAVMLKALVKLANIFRKKLDG
jgi:hypothetical protein